MLIADSWQELSLRMGLATLVGALLGLDREIRGHDAGVRTNALVAMSSAMVMICSLLLYDQLHALDATNKTDPLRVIQGVAQAIGFIAAGLIFVKRSDVHNVTTAANLWVAASVGIVAGLGQYRLLAIGAALALVMLLSEPLFHRLRPEGRNRDNGGEPPR